MLWVPFHCNASISDVRKFWACRVFQAWVYMGEEGIDVHLCTRSSDPWGVLGGRLRELMDKATASVLAEFTARDGC